MINWEIDWWKVVFSDGMTKLDLTVHPLITKGHVNGDFAHPTQHVISMHISDANLIINGLKIEALTLLELLHKTLTHPIEIVDSKFFANTRFRYPKVVNPNQVKYKIFTYE